MSLAVPATAHRCGRSRASHSASSGHLSEAGPVSPPFPAATALLCAPIVLFSIHIVSYPYFCTNAHFVQYLFFKQALALWFQNVFPGKLHYQEAHHAGQDDFGNHVASII